MNVALIVAAGLGKRMGHIDRPKQFLLINGKPLLIYTIEAFNKNLEVEQIVVVTNKEHIEEVKELCKSNKLNKVKTVVAGGETRQQSVYNGLKAIKGNKGDIVLIHDAARPLVGQRIITDNINACQFYDAVATAIKTSDTIIKSDDQQTITDVPNRKDLYQVQTPQTFKYELILSAHEEAIKNKLPDVTDDAKLVLALGHEVHLVEGDKFNFKITTSEDLTLFKALLK